MNNGATLCKFSSGHECDCPACKAEMARRAAVAALPVVSVDDIQLVLPVRRARKVRL